MFSKYAAVVKNLRGVVLLDVHEARIEEAVVWLTQRFRYRNLGVPPSLLMRGPEFFTKYAGKPFVELAYPVKSLEKLANLVESELGAEKTAAEVSVLASAYVSPILALGERGPKLLEPLGADRVESKIEPSLRDLKLHLRIADYSVLDLYQWSVENAKQLWRKNPGDLVKERAERITRDKETKRDIGDSRGEVENQQTFSFTLTWFKRQPKIRVFSRGCLRYLLRKFLPDLQS